MTPATRRPLRRALKIAAFVLLAIVVLLCAAYVFRGPLFGKWAAAKIGALLSRELGARVTVGNVGGDLFTGFELHEIRINDAAAPLARARISRVRVEYPFLGILGDAPLRRLGLIRVGGLDLEIDLTKPRPPSERPPPRIPPDLPRIEISGSVLVRTSGGSVRSENVALAGAGRSFRLRLDPLELPESWRQAPAPIEASLEILDESTLVWTSPSAIAGVGLRSFRLVTGDRPALSFELGVARGRLEGTADESAIAFTIEDAAFEHLPAWVRDPARGAGIPERGLLRATGALRSWSESRPVLAADVSARSLSWAGVSADELAASGEWSGQRISLSTVRATLGGAELTAAAADLDLADPLLVASVDSVRGSGADAARFAAALGAAPGGIPAGIPFQIEAVRKAGEPVRVTRLVAQTPDAVFEASVTVEPRAQWADWRDFPVTGSLTGRSIRPQLRDLRTDLAARAEEIDAKAAVRGTLGRPSGTIDATARGVRVGDVALDRFAASGDLDWPKATIARFEASSPLGDVEAKGTLTIGGSVEDSEVDLEASARVADLARLAEFRPELARARGRARIEGRLTKARGEARPAWSGRVTGEDLEFDGWKIGNVAALTALAWPALDVSGIEASGPVGRASGDVSIDVEAGRLKSAKLEVDGRVDRLHVSARGSIVLEGEGSRISLEALRTTLDDRHALALEEPATVVVAPGSIVVDRFAMAGAHGRVAGRLSLGDRVSIDLEARALDLAAVVPGAGGMVEADVTVSGSLADPSFTARIHAPALAWRGRTAKVECSFEQKDGVLVIGALDVDAGDLARLQGRGRLPAISWTDGRVAFGPIEDADVVLRGRTSGAAAWTELGLRKASRLSDLEVEARALGRDLAVRATGNLLVRRGREGQEEKEVPVSGAASFSPRGSHFDFRAGTAEDTLATAVLESDHPWDWTRLVEIIRKGGDLETEGRLDVEIADAAALTPFVPELRSLAGQAKIHAEVHGTVARPAFRGWAELDGGAIRFDADLPGIDDLVARLRFEGHEVTIDRLEGKSGYAPFRVTGRATFGTLRNPVLDVAIDAQRFLVARDDDLRLRADLDTTIKGPLDGMKFAGEVRVTDALWSQPLDLAGGTAGQPASGDSSESLFRFRDPPLSTAQFDVTITADKSIRVDNNLLHGTLSARLALTGSGEAPRLEGIINTDRACVRLPFTRLNIERAEIRFRREDAFRPRLDAVAATRLKGYDLAVHMSGIIPNPEVKVASLPPLTQRDAYLLLTTGIAPGELESQGVARAALNRAGSVYGSELLSRFKHACDQDALEQFTLDIGRDQSDTGQPTIDIEAPLTDRYLLHMQRDRFDDYNAGIIWRLRLK
jgi:hypothetical protein